jgi:hypothetical protein
MSQVSISYLSEITGRDRRTVTNRVGHLQFTVEGKAHLFDSAQALEAIYAADGPRQQMDALIAARTRLALANAQKLQIEIETLRKERIPIEVATAAIEPVLMLTKAKILGSDLTDDEKRALFDQLRSIPRQLGWL